MHSDELARLADLHAYEILDTDPEESFDQIVLLAARICETSWARVNFIDEHRQWTKAVLGMDNEDTPRDDAFCSRTILEPDGVMVVEDARTDPRFKDNPLVLGDPNIRFYAGSAIRSAEGRPLGAVCAIDPNARTLNDDQLEALRALSNLASAQLELRRLLTSERRLAFQKAEFMSVVAHDFRTPLTSIQGYAELLREHPEVLERAIPAIENGAQRLLHLVDDLTTTPQANEHDVLDLAELAQATVDLVRPAARTSAVTLGTDLAPAPVRGSAQRIAQALDNLIGNAVKYAPGGNVWVRTRAEAEFASVEVTDDGVGIPPDEIPRLFDRFFRASTSAGFDGSGIGLSVVKEIIDAHGGRIDVVSEPGEGTRFTVGLPLAAQGDAPSPL